MKLQLKDGITLYFSRHGETKANRKKRFSGRRDTPLTQTGRGQARAVGEILKREVGMRPSLAFVCSPLQRARTTM
jgi:probable phosphoglycerate mutase